MIMQAILPVVISLALSGSYANVEPPRSLESVSEEYEATEETSAISCFYDEYLTMRFFDVPLSDDLQRHIWNTALDFGIDPLLVYAIIEEESLFRANAVSATSDFGLCQLNSCTFEWLEEHYGVTDPLDPYQNIIGGCALLKWTKQFTDGSLDMLLLFYGCGVGRGRQLWEQGITRLTFGERMLSILEEYRNGGRDR